MSVKGDVLIVQFSGVQVNGLLSNSLSFSSDMLEGTTKDSGGVKEFTPGDWGWNMGLESLYDDSDSEGASEAIGYLKGGTSLDVYWGSVDAGEAYWAGAGYASSVEVTGPRNELANWSLEVQGSGGITEGSAS